MISMCYWHYDMIYELCYAVLATKQAIRDRRVRYLCSIVLCSVSLSSLRDSAEKRPRCHIAVQAQSILHRGQHIRTTTKLISSHNFHLLSSISDSISILSIYHINHVGK